MHCVPFILSVTHFSKCDILCFKSVPLSQVWFISTSVTLFSKCDPCFQVRPIFRSLTLFPGVSPFLPSVNLSSKSYPLNEGWPNATFLSLTLFSKCDFFSNVTNFSNCVPLFPSVAYFFKCDSFFKVWPIFPSVVYFSKCDPFFLVFAIVSSVSHFF